MAPYNDSDRERRDSWEESRLYVTQQLSRMIRILDSIQMELSTIRTEMALLKLKVTLYALAAGTTSSTAVTTVLKTFWDY